jgi:hypothetical protein
MARRLLYLILMTWPRPLADVDAYRQRQSLLRPIHTPRPMKPLLASLFIALAYPLAAVANSQMDAASLLHEALDAQGGEARLRAARCWSWRATGYRNLLEQSERPSGPYVTEFDAVAEAHDLRRGRLRRAVEARVFPLPPSATTVVAERDASMLINGAQQFPGSPELTGSAQARLAFSPERLLLTALEAADVHVEPDTVLQDVPQRVIGFTYDAGPVRIYLNKYTRLPTAVDYAGPLARSGYWSFLGDVSARTYFSFWWLTKGGVRFPLQWNLETNGLPDGMLQVHDVKVDDGCAEADLAIPANMREAYVERARTASPATLPLGTSSEIADGVVLIAGRWNVLIVRQDDGIVIIDAPISSAYSAQVMAEATRRYPGLPIKAVVTTSDAWPHVAGIRQYASHRVPIIALDLNQPLLQRVISMPYTTRPDDQERAPQAPMFDLVSARRVIGSGPRRIAVYPLRGETTERQMMVYFPSAHLLYGSDAFQPGPGTAVTFPQAATELEEAVGRAHLDVKRYTMMHGTPAAWAELPKAIHRE